MDLAHENLLDQFEEILFSCVGNLDQTTLHDDYTANYTSAGLT